MSINVAGSETAPVELARRFVERVVLPAAGSIDRAGAIPQELLVDVRESGWLGAALPVAWGGSGLDPVSYGGVIKEFGKACSSVRSLATVHNMSSQAIALFGSKEQRDLWLPDLCTARKLVAFALTEADAGSVASAISSEAVRSPGGFTLSGTKIWITAGMLADVFLVFARCDGGHVALLVDRTWEGVRVEPMQSAFGLRGSMGARVTFRNVEVPLFHQLGTVGSGISFVANAALDHGRFSVAWGALGIIEACLDACTTRAAQRSLGGRLLSEHQLVRRQLTDMLLAHSTVQLMCIRSAELRQSRDPRAPMQTALAKYHAAQSAVSVATDALRLHGASGNDPDQPLERYLRDATVLEVIEGSRESLQDSLASYALQRPHIED